MKLLLADDHTLFRDALSQYIERSDSGAEIILAEDLERALKILSEIPEERMLPDLLLLDLRMPGMNGMDGLVRVRKAYPDLPVVLMSGVAEPEDVHQALDLGARGYFPKTLSGRALLQAILLVLSGERFLPLDHANNNIMPSYYEGRPRGEKNVSVPSHGTHGDYMKRVADLPHKDEAIFSKLTPREQDVLAYLMRGASNKEIAVALDLQVVTVKLHVRGICRKLGAKNRTQAALIAQEMSVHAAG